MINLNPFKIKLKSSEIPPKAGLKEFPQFLREKTARFLKPMEISLRWTLLAIFLCLNAYLLASWTPNVIPPALKVRAQSILGTLAHVPGAQNVLGIATEQEAQSEQHDSLKKTLSYWQDVAGEHPDYKDAHLMIAALAYQLHEDDVAAAAASRALALDPNDTTAQRIRTLVENTHQ